MALAGRPFKPYKSWVLRDPQRVRILAAADTRAISPSEIARLFTISLNVAAYHVGVLRDHDFLELVAQVPARGSVKHMYRTTGSEWIGMIDWRRIAKADRLSAIEAVLEACIARLEEGGSL